MQFCSEHVEERCTLVCEDDRVLVCSVCVATGAHKSHRFAPLADAARAARTQFAASFDQLAEKLNVVDTVRQRLKAQEAAVIAVWR